MFLVADAWGDFSKIVNYKELKEMLIDELVEDTKQNSNDEEILSLNMKQLGEIAKSENTNVKYIIENLESYGWIVKDLQDIHYSLNSIRKYLSENYDKYRLYINSIDNVIQILDEIK